MYFLSALSILEARSILFFFAFYGILLIMMELLKSQISVRAISLICCSILFVLTLLFFFCFDFFILRGKTIWWEFHLLSEELALPLFCIGIHIDGLSYFFMLLVLIIGFATNIYILDYFKHEAEENTFVLLINWFIFSMLLLVSASNLVTMFLGWELIGLTSFWLINFWTFRRGTLKSAFKAFTFNKFSDMCLLAFIVILWGIYGTSSILTINFFLANHILEIPNFLFIAAILLILCSAVKSAQLMGHLWLPDSMEAPVPASALIHSATLVSAGIYLLLRFNILIDVVNLSYIILFIGAITAAYGGVLAALQSDAKKLLAYSTISHCGFLFVCVALNNHILTIIYLYLHGLFKAATFFCVGSFIRIGGIQDFRYMGGLSRAAPSDTILLILCASNLGGLPLTLGYLYKQLFLNTIIVSNVNFFILGLCFIGMLSSFVYVFRLIYFSTFDILKYDMLDTLHNIQGLIEVEKNFWSFGTICKLIAVYTIFAFSLVLYVYFTMFLINSGLTFDLFPIMLESDPISANHTSAIYNVYFQVFYALYIFIIAFVFLVHWRRSFTWYHSFNFYIFSIIVSFFLIFLFKFFL